MTDARQRRALFTLIALTVVGALSEAVTIGSVVPFLALLSGAELGGIAGTFTRVVGTSGDRPVLATLVLCSAAVLSAALRILLSRRQRDFVCDFGHRLSVELQRRMLWQPYSWHVRHNSSEQIAAIDKAELVTVGIVLPLIQVMGALIIGIAVLTVLIAMAPVPTLVAAVLLGMAYYLVGSAARRRLNAYSERMDEGFEQRIRAVQEGLGGIRDVILDATQDQVVERFQAADWRLARARADAGFISTLPRFFIEAFGIIVIALLALYLSQRGGGLSYALPILGALALGAQRLLPIVQQIYGAWVNVTANASIVRDVVRRLTLPIQERSTVVSAMPFAQSIEFRGVSLAYADRSRPAVTRLSFTIQRGSRIALIGPTGSGKSTTADLLMGLLEPDEGKILVDGMPLDATNLQAWRANIAHVPQMLFLADATIAQNVAGTREPDLQRVEQAIDMAQLGDLLGSHPDGLNARVGERGAQISGGQRQRLAIARAIYKAAPVLVLDEATSALDGRTEAAVLAALDRLQEQGTTIIIIAHRASTIEGCDQLLRLEEGRLTEIVSAAG